MGLFTKRTDPLAERARDLQAELAAVEAEIQRLQSDPPPQSTKPRLRSTALPNGRQIIAQPASVALETPAPAVPTREPVLEEVTPRHVPVAPPPPSSVAHYNEFGVRKFDLVAAWHEMKNRLTGAPSNPSRLVSLMNAGTLHGPRPLRYEQRIARNRFLALFIVLLFVLLGLFAAVLKNF